MFKIMGSVRDKPVLKDNLDNNQTEKLLYRSLTKPEDELNYKIARVSSAALSPDTTNPRFLSEGKNIEEFDDS